MTAFATAADWARFLRPIAAAVRNPPTADDMRGRAGALAFTMRVAPESLTEARQRDLCRTCEFWPSIAEIEKLFAEEWKDEARSRSITGGGFAQIASVPVSPDQRTPEQIAAVQAKAAAFYAEMNAHVAVKRAENVKPMPLSPHDLLAAYEAAGTPAAAFRAAQLRKAMEA